MTQILNSDLQAGLSANEVMGRRSQCGLNELAAPHKQNLLLSFFEQFNQPIQYILLVAALVTALFKIGFNDTK